MPHEQGAWTLRFVSVPAAKRIHGRRPTSRGRLPAAVGRREPRGKRLPSPKRDSQGFGPLSGCGQSPPVSPRDGLGKEARRGGREDGLLRARKGGKGGKTGLDRMPRPEYSPRKAKAMRCAPQLRFPGAPGKFPNGQNAPAKNSFPWTGQNPARPSAALLPRRGKQRRIRTPAAHLAPTGQGSGRKDAPTSFSARNACLRQDGARR